MRPGALSLLFALAAFVVSTTSIADCHCLHLLPGQTCSGLSEGGTQPPGSHDCCGESQKAPDETPDPCDGTCLHLQNASAADVSPDMIVPDFPAIEMQAPAPPPIFEAGGFPRMEARRPTPSPHPGQAVLQVYLT